MGTGKFGTQYPGFGTRRKRERLIFISLVAVAFLLMSVFLLSIYSRSATASKQDNANSEIAPPVAGTITLYTPARDIPAGTKVSEIEFKEIFWPRNSVPDGAVRELSQLKDMYAKLDIPYGEPIKLENLTRDRSVIRSIDITPGMRAISIEVNAKRGVEGWALPGSRVDVILTYMEEGNLTSKVVVENARVLSSGGDSSTAEERFPTGRRKVTASPTVTLEVMPEDALKIETSQQLGSLSLHLRAADDNRSSGVTSVNR
jgi:pilus assembly protein CpaB